MLSLKAPKRKRIQLPSNTPQLLYTQNDVFAEAFCTDAYTLSAQCTCFRSKLLCRCVHIAPRRRLSICIRKMMFLLKLSAQKRIHCPSQTPQHLYTQNDAFAEGFLCRSVYSTSRGCVGFCIRKMMFSLKLSAQKRIHCLPSVHAFAQSS